MLGLADRWYHIARVVMRLALYAGIARRYRYSVCRTRDRGFPCWVVARISWIQSEREGREKDFKLPLGARRFGRDTPARGDSVRKIRILVADDHELIRRGVIELVHRQPSWEVVGQAVHGQEAVEKAQKLKPDVVILDISMPRLDGLEATHQIREAVPRTEILILTMHESEQLVRRVLQAGAKGYILKSDLGRRLVAGVKAVAGHRHFLTSKVSEIVLEGYLKRGTAKSSTTQLTRREVEITRLVAVGNSNKEVAEALGITVRTVETHRSNIMRKLDLHSANALVRYAIRSKMVEA